MHKSFHSTSHIFTFYLCVYIKIIEYDNFEVKIKRIDLILNAELKYLIHLIKKKR